MKFRLGICLLILMLSTQGGITSEESLRISYERETQATALLFAKKELAMPAKTFGFVQQDYLDKYFTRLNAIGRFNGVVLICDGDKVFKKAYGFANLRKGEPLNADFRFQLASVSKPFTATAILMLAEQGKLHLTDNIKKFIPDFGSARLSLEDLLTHRSGLSDYTRAGFSVAGKDQSKVDGGDFISYICKQGRNFYSYNRHYAYSNTNYAVLANVIESVSGQKYADFMKEHIFEPLGMKSTFVYDAQDFANEPSVASGHDEAKRIYEPNYLDNIPGDKGIFSTVDDLLRFDKALSKDIILQERWQKKAYTNYTNARYPYGYGWRLRYFNDTKVIYHTGWWHGYKTKFIRMPDNGKTAIILENQVRTDCPVSEILELLDKI